MNISPKSSLRLFALLAFATATLIGSASAQIKMATVDMEKLFNDFHRTGEIQKEINIERARIQKDNNLRLADIRGIDDQIQGIRKKLEAGSLGAKEGQDLRKQAAELKQDGIHKERERTEFLERRNRALNERMRKEMRQILQNIRQVVTERAKSQNFDYILDTSGKTTQGVPFVLYASEPKDLTEKILNEINEKAKQASAQ